MNRENSQLRIAAALCLSAALVNSCGSGESNRLAQDIVMVVYGETYEPAPELPDITDVYSAGLTVRVGKLAEPMTADQMRARLTADYMGGAGNAGRTNFCVSFGLMSELTRPDISTPYVSDGPARLMSSGAMLAEFSQSGPGFYNWQVPDIFRSSRQPSPSELQLSVPGLPVQQVSIPSIEFPMVSSPAAYQYPTGYQLSWERQQQTLLPVKVEFVQAYPVCYADDDGEFSFVYTVDPYIPARGLLVTRATFSVQQQDGVLIVVFRDATWSDYLLARFAER